MALTDDEQEIVHSAVQARKLIEADGWPAFEWALQRQIEAWTRQSNAPIASMDEAVKRNFILGTINGLRLALTAPTDTINAANEILEREKELAADEKDDD